jgi:hypothetical protein
MPFEAAVYADTRAARARLVGMGAKAQDMRPAMGVVRDLIKRGHEENWESGGGSFGLWQANAPGTVARKGSSKPLEASGALRAAIFGGRGRYSRVTKSSAIVGVRLFYARFHLGTPRLPKRPMVGISPQTNAKAFAVLERYLTS